MIQAKAILRDAERILLAKHQVSLDEATAPMLSDALGEAAMLAIGPEWTKTTRAFQKTRQAHYLSAEYLIGRMVYANFYNLGILDDVRALLSRKGVDMAVLEDIEDAALGNGGLGRLAACFLDSAASLDLPLTGYGLRYRYGLFKQVLEDGMQKEIPDDWTRFGDPWSVRREELAVVVPMATGDVRAVPYDMPVIGYHTDTIGTLRLWQTESLHEFDFALFNDYKYAEACADKNRAEDITKCLYPNDWNIEGKRLRLKQQYVLSSASLQDILRQYEARHGKNYRMLPREHALQLNDTHPVLAIPELIRLLMARGVSFACAARYAREMFGYTNHTVMPEALEKWELTLVASVAPEIERILRRLERMCARETGLHIIQNGQIAMADLAVYMSQAVNGVAKLHSELVKTTLFPEWYARFPERFQNKTNGITQRRWLGLCNPELCALLSKHIEGDFIRDASLLSTLDVNDPALIEGFKAVKREKKAELAAYVASHEGVELPTDFLFDVQVKRLHEYKRQLMNALSLYDIYCELKEGRLPDFPRVAFVFGAKAAPGYARAKAIIRYILALADVINHDPAVNDRMRVCFVGNYNCSYAEKIIPAADFSEQISPAGTEASGTGNMKLMLNGAVTIGTWDGANIEIAEAAGRENEVVFGANIEQLDQIRDTYRPRDLYESDARIRRAVDSLTDCGFADEDGALAELKTSLLDGASWHKPDHYFVLRDFASYQNARLNAYALAAKDEDAFARMCLTNIKNAGFFSSDRTIAQYADEIWHIAPIGVRKDHK